MMAQNISRQQARRIAQEAAQRRVEELTPRQRATFAAQFAKADQRARLIMAHGGRDLKQS